MYARVALHVGGPLKLDDRSAVSAGSDECFAERSFDFETQFLTVDFDECSGRFDGLTGRCGCDVFHVNMESNRCRYELSNGLYTGDFHLHDHRRTGEY